jgi:ribonuclease T
MTVQTNCFISVDVETSGPIPGEFSMLTIGACVVDDPSDAFSCRLKPIGPGADPDALKVTGLSMSELELSGIDPPAAMAAFAEWIGRASADRGQPILVGFNAPFDWSFVNYYFHRFFGRNPFGFTAIDVKAYYMGVTGSTWHDTRSSAVAAVLMPTLSGTHDALDDARYQAELFRLTRARAARTSR